MQQQSTPSFFGTLWRKLVRRNDPVTSHEAAKSVDTTKLEALVYEVIRSHPQGCIADDVERAIPQHRSNTVTPRFAPLIRKGFIEVTGEKRLASSGRMQRVMRATQTTTKEIQ
jgi:hypothetical protein